MVLDKGPWFAEWHKDFNNYLVQNISDVTVDGKTYKKKQTLHSFIMGVHPKAPVIHLNGDTLDNRKCNLEIYDQNKSNAYKELDNGTIGIILSDKYGREKTKTFIDKEYLDKVINSGYTWVYYKTEEKPYAVANTPQGRLYLNRFIMNTPEDMITEHINLNTLDNRKSNLKNVAVSVDAEEEEN